jgi:hypothetical protein
MRRKVLQDFANVFCQRFVDLPDGHDLATFAHLGSGTYALDILNGACTRNGVPILQLKTCTQYRDWLEAQLVKHRVPSGLASARMTIHVTVSGIQVRRAYGHVQASATFAIDCSSDLTTDQKRYVGHFADTRVWGFDYFYQKLYGDPSSLVAEGDGP